jgi:hypothetical protein
MLDFTAITTCVFFVLLSRFWSGLVVLNVHSVFGELLGRLCSQVGAVVACVVVVAMVVLVAACHP